jgi:DNA-binding IclR family transcriptional regulator
VQSVQKFAAILTCFRQRPGDLGVSEISRITGIHKSTVSRLLSALAGEEFVICDPHSRRYRLGPSIISLAAAAEPKLFLRGLVRPYLEQLNADTGETAGFSILDGFEAVSLDAISGPRAVRAAAWSGRRVPLHASAAGKCLLAFSPPSLFEAYVGNHTLHRYTARTITDIEAFRCDLARVSERGYSSNDEELEDGLGAVSAPLRDGSGRVLGAMNLSWPVSRVQAPDRQRFVAVLLELSRRASAVFLHPGSAPAERELATEVSIVP